MILSKHLALIFSVLLIAAFAFIATPAMAIVEVTAKIVNTDGTTSTKGESVITIVYSVNADPAPTKADITDGNGTALTDAWKFAGSGKTFTLTNTTANNNESAPGSPTNGIILKGYQARSLDSTAQAMAVADGFAAGHSYLLVVSANNNDIFPTLTAAARAGIRVDWNDHDGAVNAQGADGSDSGHLPDLQALLGTNGGTLNLKLVAGVDADLSGNDDAVKIANANTKVGRKRDVIINEIMWAYDNSKIGIDDGNTPGNISGLDDSLQEQWIELYVRRTSPVRINTIRLFTNKDFPGPAEETDRVSTVPNYQTTWALTNKGQNGSSAASPNNVDFVSMERKKSEQNKDGSAANSWESADRYYVAGYKGSPAAANETASLGDRPTRKKPDAYTPPKDEVIINEVFNATGTKNDWLELRALKDTPLKDWTLSYVNAAGTETEICKLPNRTIKAGEIWLIVNTEPTEPGVWLAPGNDVTKAAADQVPGRSSYKYLKIDSFKLDAVKPDSLIILRKTKGWERFGSRDRMHDVVGTGTFDKKTLIDATPQYEPHTKDAAKGYPDGRIWETRVWPINGVTLPDYNKDKASLLQNDRNFAAGKAWARNGTAHGWQKDGGYHAGYRGGIGYDRAASAANAQGTPGYDNGAYKSSGTDVVNNVQISEIMYAHTGKTSSPPQWIELHNLSDVVAVNLNNFRLTITNHADTMADDAKVTDGWTGKAVATIMLSGYSIPPSESFLITSAKASRQEIYIPTNRILAIYSKSKAFRDAFGMKARGDAIINGYGFEIKLEVKTPDGKAWDTVQTVGNLAKARTGDDLGRGQDANALRRIDDPRWAWPSGFNEDDERVSVVRRQKTTGTELGSWILADVDERTDLIELVYYGHKSDISTPGQTKGQPLPVSLSFFRPVLENGEVTIRWTTESELDNAGFNILRSDTRNGEFKQVNTELIQGKGTTGERSTYKWVDATAKAGVVYYYQIEDVSFAGEHQLLATTRLKGLISAENKATTTWGELKSQN